MATPWDLSTAVYEDEYKDVGDDAWWPYGVFFKPDGSKMYIMGNYEKAVYQYSLSTPWSVSTASYEDKNKYVDAQDSFPLGVFFKPDGSKMYIAGWNSRTVYQYTLSTLWDVSTATYDTKSKYIGDKDSEITGVFFKSDGTEMYVTGNYTDTVYQYTLSAAWDVSTASYSESKDVSSEDTYPMGTFFKPDGTKMYITGTTYDMVHQYSLSTPWSVSTAGYEDKYKDVGSEDSYPTDVFFNPDGTKMYIMGNSSETVYQYSLPAPPAEQTVSGVLTFVGATIKETSSDLSGALSFVGSLINKIATGLSGILTLTGILTNKIKTKVLGALTFVGVLINKTAINLRGVISLVGVPTKGLYQSLIGSLNFVGVLTRFVEGVYYQSISGVIDFSGAISKKVRITLSGVITFIGTLIKWLPSIFTTAELSIEGNKSDLSVESNGSELSIESNKSDISIKGNESELSIDENKSVLSIYHPFEP